MSKFRSIFADSRTKVVALPADLVGSDDLDVTVHICKISHAGKRRINDAERTRAHESLKFQMDELGKDGLEMIEGLRSKYQPTSGSGDDDDPTMVARPSRVEREAASIAAEADAKAAAAAPPSEYVDTDSVEQMLGSMDLVALLKEGVSGWNVLDEDSVPVPFDEMAIDALADDIVTWLAEHVLIYNRRSFRLSGEGRSRSAKR